MATVVTQKWAVLLVIIGWFILCKPWFFGNRVVPYDSKAQFYPFARFVSQSIRSGESPFWNPYVYAGYPMASDPQSMMFSPIAMVMMLIPTHPSVHWFDTVELLHILIGGLGMLCLSMRFGHSPIAALFSATVFMFGGSASARMQHVPMIYAYAYFPFALLALEQMLALDSLKWAVCLGLLAGMMAAHMNQVAYLLTLVLIGYYIYRAASSPAPWGFVLFHWRCLLVALGLAMGVLVVPLYLVVQFLPFSNRPSIPYEVAVANSLSPLSFLTLVFRNFFGNARPDSAWGPWDPTESLFYVGTLPIVLILRYGLATATLVDRQFRYFATVGLLAILYSVGKWTPFYWIAYHLAPGVSFYRRPNDATFVLNFVLALATGFLADQLRGGARKVRRSVSLIAGIAYFAFFASGLSFARQQHQLLTMTMGRDIALAAVFILVSLWLWRAIASARSDGNRTILMLVGLVLLAADLGVHTVGSRLNAVSDTDLALLSDKASQDSIVKFLEDGLESRGPLGLYRTDITAAGAVWANAPMILGIQSTEGYNPLRYSLVDRVVGAQESFGITRPFSPLMRGYDSPLLNLLGVKYIVSTRAPSDIDPHVEPRRFLLVHDNGIQVWQNPDVLPRVMAFTAIYVEPDLDGAIDAGSLAPVDYRSTVVLTKFPDSLSGVDSSPHTRVSLPGNGGVHVRLVDYRNTEVTIAVDSQRDAIVELHDPYYFAWHVYVDGQQREMLQSNYMFRGVHVKPGERRIVFRFEPFSWSSVRE